MPRELDVSEAVEMLDLYAIVEVGTHGIRYAAQAFEEYLAPFRSTAIVNQWAGELA